MSKICGTCKYAAAIGGRLICLLPMETADELKDEIKLDSVKPEDVACIAWERKETPNQDEGAKNGY